MNCLLFLAFISWVGMFDNPASAASWKIPLINYWYASWNRERPSRLVQTVRERCLIYLNMRAGPAAAAAGREKSMQMIIYDRCRTLPKAQFRSLYNFGRKPVGVESIYQLLELQSGGCHKCHKCLGILRKSDFSEHRLFGTNPFISNLEQEWSGFCQKRHKWLGDARRGWLRQLGRPCRIFWLYC